MMLPAAVAIPAIIALGVVVFATAAAWVPMVAVPLIVAAITAGPSYLALRQNSREVASHLFRLEEKIDRHLEAHATSGASLVPLAPVAEVVHLDDHR